MFLCKSTVAFRAVQENFAFGSVSLPFISNRIRFLFYFSVFVLFLCSSIRHRNVVGVHILRALNLSISALLEACCRWE
jgi:hypothetical protein